MMTALKPIFAIVIVSVGMIFMQISAPLFAQSHTAVEPANATMPESLSRSIIEPLAQTLGPLFILGWYLYRHETKTLPDKDRQLAKAQEAFSEELASIRLAHEKTVEALVAQVQRHADMVMAIVQKCPGINQ